MTSELTIIAEMLPGARWDGISYFGHAGEFGILDVHLYGTGVRPLGTHKTVYCLSFGGSGHIGDIIRRIMVRFKLRAAHTNGSDLLDPDSV